MFFFSSSLKLSSFQAWFSTSIFPVFVINQVFEYFYFATLITIIKCHVFQGILSIFTILLVRSCNMEFCFSRAWSFLLSLCKLLALVWRAFVARKTCLGHTFFFFVSYSSFTFRIPIEECFSWKAKKTNQISVEILWAYCLSHWLLASLILMRWFQQSARLPVAGMFIFILAFVQCAVLCKN